MFFIAFGCQAQDMKALWTNMPDDMTPYLNKAQRKEMAEFVELGVKGDTGNTLGGTSVLDTITADYLHVTLSEAKTVEMKLLKTESDSVLCMVTSLMVPEKKSQIDFYDMNWQKLDADKYIEAPYSIDLCLHRPDTMTEENYQELQKLIELPTIDITMSEKEGELVIKPSFPLTSKEDKMKLEAIVLQRKLKWNGHCFK